MNSLGFNKDPSETTVVVAMSGGVDSSVTAGLLKKEGYNVIGITLQLYSSNSSAKKGSCCSGIDIYDARRVAQKLDIPHYVFNYEKTFKEDVIDYFIKLSELESYGEIYNIGQTNEISIKDLAQLIIDTTSSNSEIKFLSHKDVFGDKFEDPTRRTPNIDKIVKATGMKPSYDIQTMIKEIVEYKRQN